MNPLTIHIKSDGDRAFVSVLHEIDNAETGMSWTCSNVHYDELRETYKKAQATIKALYYEQLGVMPVGDSDLSFAFDFIQQCARGGFLPISTITRADSQLTIFAVQADNMQDALTMVRTAGFDRQRCHHEHDCCGNWYGDTPTKMMAYSGVMFVAWEQRRNV